MRFDWYAATVPVAPTLLIDALRSGLEVSETSDGPGRHGYAQRLDLVGSTGELAATIYLPRPDSPTHPHAYASGDRTEAFVYLVRSCFPEHRVTRCDSCYDVEEKGAFDRIVQTVRDLAKGLGLQTSVAGDWFDERLGRTLYVGAPSSPVRLRVYEKGKQMAQGLPDNLRLAISPDWVRVELQVRPQKDAKGTAAAASPEAVWGFSAWSQQAASHLLQLDVPRIEVARVLPADDERAYRFMVRQYGPLLRRLASAQGWEGLLWTLRDDVEEDGRRRRA